MTPATAPAGRSVAWTIVILLLLAIRMPSLVEPAGADQNLYAYVGDRVTHGDVPYRDAWDQKPPAIHFIYAALRRLWPSDAVVAGADLAAAAAVAWLLVMLGRRTFGTGVGFGAATLFLLLGNPAIQRLGGVRVRSQCETFIALAMTAALVLLSGNGRRRYLWAGVCLGAAFWLKYNAIVYALPLLLDLRGRFTFFVKRPRRSFLVSFLVIATVFISYFAVHGALTDLWLATITYNLQYSQETYQGVRGALRYLTFPLERAHLDLLWYLGGLGVLALLFQRHAASRLVVAWMAAACVSIAINGARNLPQYFVQAHPALALAAAAGLAPLARRDTSPAMRAILLLLVAAGLWRVGDEPRLFRVGGLPEVAQNVAFDLDYARGRIDRSEYLARFQQQQDAKYVPLAAERLAAHVRETTRPDDRILVFGFSADVYVHSGRVSASRFFWSRPVTVEFNAARAGYGSAGLLADLQRSKPVVVALQKHWGGSPPEPIDFFMSQPMLRAWLQSGYVLEDDNPAFAVWRRRS